MVENFFPAIDFVGVPVTMSLYGREKYKTTLGGICSVLFSAFFIWSIYNTATELFSTVNPKVVTYQSYTADPGAISVTNDAFPIGFALKAPAALDYILIKDETIFTIEIYHNRQVWIQNSNGTRTANWTASRVYTEDCPDDYFGTQETSLSTFNLSQVFCIAKEQPELDSLEIQGVLSSDVYQEIVVKVIVCNTTTSSGVACASPDKISQYLTGSWFNAIYVNMLANPQNYTQPNNTFQDAFYTMIDPTSYREVEMQLGYTQINTDRGWIVEDIKTKTYLNVNDVKNFVQTTKASDNVLLNCVIKASQFETFYTRSYKKIQICVAEVWSTANLVLLIIIVLINPFLKMRFRELLMNELFDVQIPQKENKKIQKKKKSSRSFLDIMRSNSITVRETDREENRINAEPLSSKMLTNLNTSHDRKGFERMNTSPPSTARPLISRGLALEGRKGSSDNAMGYLNRPKPHLLKKSATIGPPNDSLWKRRMHSRTVTQIEDIQEEPPIEEKESHNERKLEEEMANINRLKLNLPKGHRKTDLISRTHVARKVKNKSLGDENSLHISSSSEDEEAKSEGEYDTRREERIEYKEIMIPHLGKRIDSGNEDLEDNKEKYINAEKTQQDLQTAFTSNEREKEKEQPQKEVGKSITMSIWEYVYWFTMRPQSLQKKKEIHDDGIKKVNERLDIANLMKKLREIDKLRSLLLDKDQLVLFNNLPKPEIGQKSMNYVGRGSAMHEFLQDPRFIGEGAKKQIINSFHNIKSKKDKTEIDKKLIEIFEENK